jgi:hypothetical protein
MGQNRELESVPPHRQSESVVGTRHYFFPKTQAILTLKLSLLRTVLTDAEDSHGETKFQFLFNLRDTEHVVRLLC